MKKGFDFFEVNLNNREYISDLSKIIDVPEIFGLFTETFKVDSSSPLVDGVLDEDGDFESIGSVRINGLNISEPIYLNNFLDSSEILAGWDVSKTEIEWEQHSLLRIAFLGQAGFGGLYLGCAKSNLDEIWIFNSDADEQFIKVGNNIFEFIKRLSFSTEFSNISLDNYCNLYRNWEDKIWKIKE